MNKARRERLQDILDELEGLRTSIELILDEEQEAYDNIPESLQMSERAEQSGNCIAKMEDVIDSLDQATEDLEEMLEE